MLVLGPDLLLEAAEAVRYPLKVSENGRHLLDQDNQPVYVHGDTGWTLFCDVSLADAETYLENRRQKGFNAVNVMLVSAGWNQYDFSTRSFDGHLPFHQNLAGGAWIGRERKRLVVRSSDGREHPWSAVSQQPRGTERSCCRTATTGSWCWMMRPRTWQHPAPRPTENHKSR